MNESSAERAVETRPLLRCKDLSRCVGKSVVLDSVSFEMMPGELAIVSGPSGAGKTTLLRLIAGLDRPTAGTIEIDDAVVSSASRYVAPAQRGLGMVFEQAALWPHLTVERHLELVLKGARLGVGERRERIERLLGQMRLVELRRRFPHELSAGERQRVALARSLALSPRLLLLDDPLARLDVHLAAELAALLQDLHEREGLTTLCVMHRPERVNRPGTQYIVLEKGRLVQAGPEADVFRSPQTPFVEALAKSLGY